MKPRNPKVSNELKEILNNSIRDDLIITPLLDEFLLTWDENFSEEAAKRVQHLLTTPQRDRSASFSASSAGLCLRRQELQFLGMPVVGKTDAHLMKIFQNGRWVHLRWQALLMTAQIIDNIEVTHRKPRHRARCSLDGLGVAKRGRWVGSDFGFELKGRNDYVFKSQVIKSVDEKTRKQVDFMHLLTGLDLFVIMNENKNTQENKEWVFQREDDRVRDMAKQVKELNRAIDIQRLHPMLEECRRELKNGEFYVCPFGGPGGSCVASGNWPATT